MLKLLNVSARPSFPKLRLFQSSLSHSLVVKCKLSSVTCSLIVGILCSRALLKESGGIAREFVCKDGLYPAKTDIALFCLGSLSSQ